MESERMAQQAVDRIETIFGEFPGYRRAHARGKTYRATFRATGEGEKWTTAPHFQQGETEASVRFSHFSPDPTWADAMSPVKGMAVQLKEPQEDIINIVGVTSPVFFAKTPESFMDMLEVTKSFKKGKPNGKELLSLLTDFPESRAMMEAVQKMHAPAGFGAGRYHSLHAYYFINRPGSRQPVKYVWEPVDGKHNFSAQDVAGLPVGFYEADIEDRLRKGPLVFNLDIVLGEQGDPTDDPTQEWPVIREKRTIGQLTILEEDPSADAIRFDPTQVTDGIECSEDPILHFRHPAYRISHNRRSKENGTK